jgi:hypothetical protein
MGIFANRLSDLHGEDYVPVGDFAPRIQGRDPEHGLSGYAAMGHPVPFSRQANAYRHMIDMGWKPEEEREKMHEIIGKMSDYLARDNSHEAMEYAYQQGVPVICVYRLLAVLLTPAPPQEPPTTASEQAQNTPRERWRYNPRTGARSIK